MDKNNKKIIIKRVKTKEKTKKKHNLLSKIYNIFFWVGLLIVIMSYTFNKLAASFFGLVVMSLSLLILCISFYTEYHKKRLFNIIVYTLFFGTLSGIIFFLYLQRNLIIPLLKSPLKESWLIYLLMLIIALIIIVNPLNSLYKSMKSKITEKKKEKAVKKILSLRDGIKKKAGVSIKKEAEKNIKKQKKETKIKITKSITYILLFFISFASAIYSYIKAEKIAFYIFLSVMLASIFIYGRCKKKIKKQKPEEKPVFIAKELIPKKYETELDVLYNLLQKKEKIRLYDVMRSFKIDRNLAEEWAAILEKHGMLKIEYPAVGSPLLIKEKKTEK